LYNDRQSTEGKCEMFHSGSGVLYTAFCAVAVQYNLELEAAGIRTFQSELRMLSADLATTVTRGCDVIEIFRPQHHRGVQTVVQEELTSHVARGQMLEAAVMTDPLTGRHMTLSDAARLRLFDVASGRLVDPNSGRRLSLHEAVQLGYVNEEFASQLQTGSGMHDPASGRELTVMEAIQKGYIDVSSGTVKDPRTGEELSAADAVKRGLLSSDVANHLTEGEITVRSKTVVHGYYGATDFPSTQLPALPLHDVINKDVYDAESGKMIEPVTRQGMTLNDAVQSALVNASQREVYDPTSGDLITVAEAIDRGIIDPRSGKYVDLQTGTAIGLAEAVGKKLIEKQLPLHTALTAGLITPSGHLHDYADGSLQRLTLMEAVERGILDTEFKCILDTQTGEVLSLSEAIQRGLINAQGQFIDPHSGSVMPLPAAVNEGLALIVQNDISFAEHPIIDSKTGDQLTSMEAIAAGIIDPSTNMYVDKRSGRKMPLVEAERSGLVESGFSDKLLSLTGYRDASGKQLSVLELINSRQFDPATGQLLDPHSGHMVSLEDAVLSGLIESSDAALLLKTTSPVIATTRITSEIQYGSSAGRSVKQAIQRGLLQDGTGFDSDSEAFPAIPKKRAKSDIVPEQSAGVATLSTANVQRGVDEHQKSEDTEEYTEQIADGTEHVRRSERREFHGRRTEDGGYESLTMQERHVSSLVSTSGVTGLSGHPDLPMSFSDAIAIGFLNPDTGYCQDPTSKKEYTVQTALVTGLLDSETASFIDPVSAKKCDIKTAINKELLEPTAHYTDRRTNERLSLRNLMERGIIFTQSKRDRGVRAVASSSGATGSVHETKSYTIVGAVDPNLKTRVDVNTAIQRGIIDLANGLYMGKDEAGKRFQIPVSEAIERGLVFTALSGTEADQEGSRFVNTTKTFSVQSVVDPTSGKQISITEAIQHGIVDENNLLYTNPRTGETMPITEAVNRGFIVATVTQSTETASEPAAHASQVLVSREVAYTLQSVIDPRTNRELTVSEAVSLGILDSATNEFHHPVTGEVMSLDEAIARGLARVQRGRPSADKDAESEEERVPSIHIDDEEDALEVMTTEKVSEEHLKFQIAGVVDPESGDVIPYNDAIENGLVDEEKGMYINPQTGQRMHISEALERGIIVGKLVEKTEERELFHSTVVARRIDDIATVFNPLTRTQIPVSQAIHLGLIGRDLVSYYNPATDETMSIDEAVRRGLAATRSPSAAKKMATDGVMAVVNWDTGMIVERSTGEHLTSTEALRRRLIDEATARMIDKQRAAKKKTETVADKTPVEDVHMIIRTTEVVEKPPSAITIEETISSPGKHPAEEEFEGLLSFDAAVKLGLFNVKTGKFFNRITGDDISLSDAVNSCLINSTLRALVDLRTGKECTLDQALDRQLISLYTGRLNMSQISATNMLLDPRFLPDVDWKLELSIQDAVACRLFDVESGLLLHPLTRQRLTLSDAVSDGVVVGDATIVVNLDTGTRMSLTEALADGIINGQTGKMRLSAAIAGSSDAAELTLLHALSYGLIVSCCPPDSTSVINKDTGEKLSIDDAIRHGLTRENASIVYNSRSRERVSITRAIQQGIVDRQTLFFCDPDTKRRVAPVDAARLGLMRLPGAPVLSDVARLALIQSAFENDIATEKDARLKEKVTELAEAVLAPVADLSVIAATPEKGGDSKTVQSSTETEPMTVTVEDGVLRMTQKTRTVVGKTETKRSTLGQPKHTPLVTDSDARTSPLQPPELTKHTPSAASPIPRTGDVNLAELQSKVTSWDTVATTSGMKTPAVGVDTKVTTVDRKAPAVGVETVTTTSVTTPVGGKTAPMDVDSRSDTSTGHKPRRLPEIPQPRKFTAATKLTVVEGERMIDTGNGETVPASEALRRGLVEIDWNTGMIKNTRTGELLTAEEALRRGLIDSHIKNIIDNRLRAGVNVPDVITLNDALTTGLLLVPLGRIRNPTTNQRMTVEEAVDVGFLDPDCSVIIDPASQRVITLTEAEKSGLMDFHTGDVKNRATGKTLTLTEMALQGYIPERGLSRSDLSEGIPGGAVIDISRTSKTKVTGEHKRPLDDVAHFSPVSLYEAVERGLIDMDTGYFRHPLTGEVMSLSEAVMRGYVSVPLREGDMEIVGIGFEEAFRRGLIDIRNNTFTEPLTEVLMPLDAAIRNGYVIIPESGIQLRITEEKEERMSETVDECRTVGEMCGDGIIQFTRTTETTSSVDDAPRGMCLMDAISDNSLDAETGLFTDQYTRQAMNFAESLYNGFIEPRSAKVSSLVLMC